MSNKTNRSTKKNSSTARGNSVSYRHTINDIMILRHLKEVWLIILLALAGFFLISLGSYHPFDAGWSRTSQHLEIMNIAGNLGAWWADLFLYFFGIPAYLFPISLISCSLINFFNKEFNNNLSLWGIRCFGFIITLLSSCSILSLLEHQQIFVFNWQTPISIGGILGDILSDYFFEHANFWGTVLILSSCLLAGITAMTGISWFNLIKLLYYIVEKIILSGFKCATLGFIMFKNIFNKLLSNIKRLYKKQGAIINKRKTNDKDDTNNFSNIKNIISKFINKLLLVLKKNNDNNSKNNNYNMLVEKPENKFVDKIVLKNNIDLQQQAARNFIKQMENNNKNNKNSNIKLNTNVQKIGTSTNILPNIDLLESSSSADLKYYADNLPDASNIQAKLADFGIIVKIVDIFPGPVVTRVEMELAPGTKASKITTLSKDLARSLSVPSVRVVEVIPGKTVVGLEIPNKKRVLVRLRDVLSSEQYVLSTSCLSLALGKDISGVPIITDLSRMPHLLVAGTTGSGKSVGVNIMLLSILFKATPEDVRLILIDPKMLELSIYDGIPHLLTPVVTDMKDAANALNWCVFEMERRYKLMASIGVRNLSSFNMKAQTAHNTRNPISHPFYNPNVPENANNKKYLEKLPYIVVIIDEFADMMMVVGKKVEEQISRIAQKARAAGIHMILATQRPSVDVITGLIKANIPTRIAFQVSSRIDSRTILDQQGAEQLLGNGDLLYLPPGSGIPVRVHGAFVSDEEVHKVVTCLKEYNKTTKQAAVDLFNLSKMQEISGNNLDFEDCADFDPLYDEAVAIVTSSRKASISYLQRRLKIGFNRAARLIEDMQKQNIVSTQSNGVREVLAPPPPSSQGD